MKLILKTIKFALMLALVFAATMGASGLVCCVVIIPVEHLDFTTSFRLMSVFASPLLICVLWFKLNLWGAPTVFQEALQHAGQTQSRILKKSRTARIIYIILMILTAIHTAIQMQDFKRTLKEKPNQVEPTLITPAESGNEQGSATHP
ncbi:MAG: hypothetical protein JXR40_08925 [Pontiellaceae bacterium]|nr:hypothetical protein [Pontiellaceae bacterium]